MTTGFIDKAALAELAASFGVSLDETALDRFDLYAKLLCDWNEKINLTAITDPGEIVVKHFADSLSVLGAVSVKEGASLIDVGTGAGFPGLALKIARPDLRVTLLDSTKKKLLVLEDIAHWAFRWSCCICARRKRGNRPHIGSSLTLQQRAPWRISGSWRNTVCRSCVSAGVSSR